MVVVKLTCFKKTCFQKTIQVHLFIFAIIILLSEKSLQTQEQSQSQVQAQNFSDSHLSESIRMLSSPIEDGSRNVCPVTYQAPQGDNQGHASTEAMAALNIVFKSDTSQSELDQFEKHIIEQGGTIKHKWSSPGFKGFSVIVPQAKAGTINTQQFVNIQSVECDGTVSINQS